MAYALLYQAITLTNFDLSSNRIFCDIHLRALSHEMLINLTRSMYSNNTLLKLLTFLQGANESRNTFHWYDMDLIWLHMHNFMF